MFSKYLQKRSKSILFINPDYHCTFVYKKELEKNGWTSEIFVPSLYPKTYLYNQENILISKLNSKFLQNRGIDDLILFGKNFFKYKFHFYYGRPPLMQLSSKFAKKIFGKTDWNVFLFLSKISGAKIIYLPSGCRDEFNRETFKRFDEGRVCMNCAFYQQCDEQLNNLNLRIMKKYSDLNIGAGFFRSPFIHLTALKWKSIDLDVWHPSLKIPTEFQLRSFEGLTVFHSPSSGARNSETLNIKGSIYLREAVDRLSREGFSVRLIEVENMKINDVKYFQKQADVIVDQLIYGQWGSVGIESMAMGKPVICYIRESWEQEFLNNFPEYSELPIIKADIASVYAVLKSLIENRHLLNEYGIKSRLFAEQHFNPKNNALELLNKLNNLR